MSKYISIRQNMLQFSVLTAICIKICNASLQQVTFFEKYGCSGNKNETFTETQDELDKIWVTNSSSIFIVGLWTLTLYQTTGNGTRETKTYIHENAKPPHGVCLNKTDFPKLDVAHDKFLFAARYGPLDMTTRQVIFFTDEWCRGLHFVADINEQDHVTPRPLAIWSQLIFSNDSWTSYAENNFTGKATHYIQSGQFGDNGTIVGPPLKDNYSVNNSYLGIVSSVKMGIHGDNIEEDAQAKCTCKRANRYLSVTLLIFVISAVTF